MWQLRKGVYNRINPEALGCLTAAWGFFFYALRSFVCMETDRNHVGCVLGGFFYTLEGSLAGSIGTSSGKSNFLFTSARLIAFTPMIGLSAR